MKTLRLCLWAFIAIAVSGCKLDVMVPPGGTVASASDARNCDGSTGGNYCTFDLTTAELPFIESFSASAMPGYRFVKWQKAAGFACGDSTDATCIIAISDNSLGRTLLAGFGTRYLMPVFEYLGIDTDGDGILDLRDADDDNDGIEDSEDSCPLSGPNDDGFGCPYPPANSVIVDGKEWVQPSLFNGVSWEDVNDVCPSAFGVHSCTGTLDGINLKGWRWATSAEVRALVNTYSGTGNFCTRFAADFDFTIDDTFGYPAVLSWVADTSTTKYAIIVSDIIPCFQDAVRAEVSPATTGSWFYRARF